MHKSVIILLGLLVMLLPFGTSMINTNAIAFEDYGYGEADRYQKYAMDMANDNYYKSQGSDLIKKIKCNNINSNFNGVEANIGTGDSLGLDAEALETDDASANWLGNGDRNNGNFDLDCINNNDNAGQGAKGPQGPQGPAGPSGIGDISFYLNQSWESSGDVPNEAIIAIASCEPGDVVTGGGYITNTFTEITINAPTGTQNSWTAAGFPTGGNLGSIIDYPICFDNPPFNTLAAADVSAFQQQSEDSPLISQGTGDSPKLTALEKQQPNDSPELTATEKITKLKTQWLDLLP